MTDTVASPDLPDLDRPTVSAALERTGWRLVLGSLLAAVPATSLQHAVQVVGAAVAACGADADGHLWADVRPDRVELSLQTRTRPRITTGITQRDLDLASAVERALDGLGLTLLPATGPERPVQRLEICLDAMDIPSIRPFWLAVLGMVPEPGHDDPDGAIIDPVWQLPAVWFQQMDEPRTQRNRIHFDIAVPHEEALARVEAAVAAGGTLLDDSYARSFWILADPEGNEICVCTWQDRD